MKKWLLENIWLMCLVIITLTIGITFHFIDKEISDIFFGIFTGSVLGCIISKIKGDKEE